MWFSLILDCFAGALSGKKLVAWYYLLLHSVQTKSVVTTHTLKTFKFVVYVK